MCRWLLLRPPSSFEIPAGGIIWFAGVLQGVQSANGHAQITFGKWPHTVYKAYVVPGAMGNGAPQYTGARSEAASGNHVDFAFSRSVASLCGHATARMSMDGGRVRLTISRNTDGSLKFVADSPRLFYGVP